MGNLGGLSSDAPEEYYDHTKGWTSVQSGTQNIIVLRPPREMPATDDVLEDEPHDRPGHVIDSCGRRDSARTREYDREATKLSAPTKNCEMEQAYFT